MAVLVAGGTGALGGAVLRELLDAGYEVSSTWLVDRERERIESDLGDRVTLIHTDLFDDDAAAAAVEAVPDLEAVVNLVGGFAAGPKVHEVPSQEFERLIQLNLGPAFRLARAAMPRADETTLLAATLIAQTAVDLFLDPAFVEAAWTEFRAG